MRNQTKRPGGVGLSWRSADRVWRGAAVAVAALTCWSWLVLLEVAPWM
jgi:hypothetical protein